MDSATAKIQYYRQYLEAGIREIMTRQRAVISSHIARAGESGVDYGSSGRAARLMELLKSSSPEIAREGSGVRASWDVPLALRFADMKHLGNWKVYNRQVWPMMYGEVLQDIKYEYRAWIAANFPELLKQAGG